MKLNGDDIAEGGISEPSPSSDIITLVALPPKVLPLTVIAVVPHVLPLVLERVTFGGLAHPQVTEKLGPVVIHPEMFLTDIL